MNQDTDIPTILTDNLVAVRNLLTVSLKNDLDFSNHVLYVRPANARDGNIADDRYRATMMKKDALCELIADASSVDASCLRIATRLADMQCGEGELLFAVFLHDCTVETGKCGIYDFLRESNAS